MKQIEYRNFIKTLIANGYKYSRTNGSHHIFTNNHGNHVSVPKNLACVIALRLIKENNLNTNLKLIKRWEKKKK